MNNDDRLRAIREAAQRQAYERREREHKPGDGGRLAGRYFVKERGFTLVWSAADVGYRRRFDPSAWVWDEAAVYSTDQVRTFLARKAWTTRGTLWA